MHTHIKTEEMCHQIISSVKKMDISDTQKKKEIYQAEKGCKVLLK